MILINQNNEIISGKSHPILESDKTVLKTYFFCHKGGGRSGLIPISESNYHMEKGIYVKVSATSVEQAKDIYQSKIYMSKGSEVGIYEVCDNINEDFWNFFTSTYKTESDLMKGGVMVEYE